MTDPMTVDEVVRLVLWALGLGMVVAVRNSTR